MSRPKNHTLDTVCRMLGGTYHLEHPSVWEKNWEASICNCNDHYIIEAEAPTRKSAIAALEAKLRACAVAVLSDEWDWEE